MQEPQHDCERVRQLSALLERDAWDAAIDAGLMQFAPTPCMHCPADRLARIASAQQQLQVAWDARERYRARQARLQQRADARARARLQRSDPTPSAVAPTPPALPPAVAAALARAKAKAAGRAP
jgi:hypothetical protein